MGKDADLTEAIGWAALGLGALAVALALLRLLLSPALVGALLSGAAGLGVAYAFGVVDRLAAWYACYDLSERLGAAVRVGSLAISLSRTSGAVVAEHVSLAMAAGFPGGGTTRYGCRAGAGGVWHPSHSTRSCGSMMIVQPSPGPRCR